MIDPRDKKISFVIITMIIFLVIVAIAYFILPEEEGKPIEPIIPGGEDEYGEVLEKLGGKEARVLTEEEKLLYEETLERLGGEERELTEEEKEAYDEALEKLSSPPQ